MKFFKHFTDADEGTLNDLMNKLGVEAYGRYWLFAEFCIKGLEKPAEREFVEADMIFSFNERQLREKLRIKSVNLGKFLGTCSELNLFQVSKTEDKFDIYFPKILKFLDRDSKRARKLRAKSASGARQDKEEDKDKEEDVEDVQQAWLDEAELWFEAVRLHPNDYLAIKSLSAHRQVMAASMGGIKHIRDMKQNDFELRRLARRLRKVNEKISNQESA